MKSYLEAKNAKELCKLMGLPETEAPKIEMRTQLVVAIKRIIDRNKWTQDRHRTSWDSRPSPAALPEGPRLPFVIDVPLQTGDGSPPVTGKPVDSGLFKFNGG